MSPLLWHARAQYRTVLQRRVQHRTVQNIAVRHSIAYTFFLYKKRFISKCGSNSQNLNNILKHHEAQLPKLSVFIGYKSIFCHYYIQNVKDGIQIQAYNVSNEFLTHFHQFVVVNVKKNSRKSHYIYISIYRNILGSISGKIKKTEAPAK